MKVKSLEELKTLRKQYQDKIELRETGKKSQRIEILVGMATCGIASGAKETYDRLQEMINQRRLENIDVVMVGCLGYCYLEPTLQVCIPGKAPLLYQKITVDKAEEFLDKAVLGKGNMNDAIIDTAFERVVSLG